MIAEILPTGKKNRVSLDYLMKSTGIKSERGIRRAIAEERKKGFIILSCPSGGYFLPENKEEIEKYVKTMDKEAKSILYSLKAAKEYLNDVEGQLSIDI